MWNSLMNITRNIGENIKNAVFGFLNSIKNAFQNVFSGIVEAAKNLWRSLVGGSIFPDMLARIQQICAQMIGTVNVTISNINDEIVKAQARIEQFEGRIARFRHALVGLRAGFGGMHLRTPVPFMGSTATHVETHIHAPLVRVEGSADRRTALLAARMVEEALRTVLIESTSSAAPTKRIRWSGMLGR